MNVTELEFYPLHISVMNFSEPVQHLMNGHWLTILSFTPVQFRHAHDYTYAGGNSLERLTKLNTFIIASRSR